MQSTAPSAAELDLLRAALLPDERAVEAWNRWRLEADRLEAVPRLLPLAEWNLRRISGCGSLTGQSPDPLQGCWIRNQRTIDGVTPVLRALRARSVQVIAVKGFALASTVYPSPATRPIGDVDLLVRRADSSVALETIRELGWRETGDRALSARPHLHGFELERDGLAIDLHTSALYECRAIDADEDFWSRCRTFDVRGVGIGALAPSDHLLLLCVHGLRWSARPTVHWVADAALVIRRAGEDLDWDALSGEATRRSLELPVGSALRLLRDEVEAEIPEAVVGGLQRARTPAWQRLEARWRGRAPTLRGGLFLHWCDWRRANPGRTALWCLPRFPRFLAELWGVERRRRLPLVALSKIRGRLS